MSDIQELIKLVSSELSDSSKTLRGYEKMVIENKVTPEMIEFVKERIKFWSDSVLELRKQLAELRK